MKFGELFEYVKFENNIYHDVKYEGKDYKYAIITDGVIEFFVDDEADEAHKVIHIEPKEYLVEALKIYLRQKQATQSEESLAKMASYLADTVESRLDCVRPL